MHVYAVATYKVPRSNEVEHCAFWRDHADNRDVRATKCHVLIVTCHTPVEQFTALS